jgi:hypothetical protein
MFSSRWRPDETVGEVAPVDPPTWSRWPHWRPKGFGYDSPYVRTPRGAVDGLAAQLGGEVVLDDLGRRCVSRDMARRLFAERVAAEAWRRAVVARQEAEQGPASGGRRSAQAGYEQHLAGFAGE